MFLQIERSLEANKCLSMPCVHISPDVDKQLAGKLKEIVKRHQGTVTDDEDDATHIVNPLPEDSNDGNYILMEKRNCEFYKVI